MLVRSRNRTRAALGIVPVAHPPRRRLGSRSRGVIAERGVRPPRGPHAAIDRSDHQGKVVRQSREGSVLTSHAEPKQHDQDNPRMSQSSELGLTGSGNAPTPTMLRALFVTSSFAYGGAEKQAITLMNRLAARGHECHAAYIKDNHALLDRVRLRAESTVRCLSAEHYPRQIRVGRSRGADRESAADRDPRGATLLRCCTPRSRDGSRGSEPRWW